MYVLPRPRQVLHLPSLRQSYSAGLVQLTTSSKEDSSSCISSERIRNQIGRSFPL